MAKPRDFLAYMKEPYGEHIIEHLAQLYAAANRECWTDLSEEHIPELKNVCVVEVIAHRTCDQEHLHGKCK